MNQNNYHSPLEIELLFHCYVSPERFPRIGAPAVVEALLRFKVDGILQNRGPDTDLLFEVTEKGKAWIEMILSTPYPVSVWMSPARRPRIVETEGE